VEDNYITASDKLKSCGLDPESFDRHILDRKIQECGATPIGITSDELFYDANYSLDEIFESCISRLKEQEKKPQEIEKELPVNTRTNKKKRESELAEQAIVAE
jgi:hypothetical protein